MLRRVLLPLLLLAAPAAAAQTADSLAVPDSLARPPATILSDTLAAPDPGAVADTLQTPAPPPQTETYGVPLAPPAEGGLERPVTFTAVDSLRLVFGTREGLAEGERPDDRAALYGSARAQYDTATLEAGIVEILFGPEVLRATPLASDSGEVGIPQFSEGTDGFTGRELAFNLRTRRGRIVGARTQLQDGFLIGGVVKQAAPHIIYASDAAYTTCDLDHPHYAVEAGRIKVVDGKTVYTGPVRLRLLGLPTPLWLPFGFFPATEGRRSGPLAVGYGRSTDFGLYLSDLGYYWAASDYLGVLGKLRIGTTGSVQGEGQLQYVRKYAYDGTLSLSYGRLRRGEREDLDFAISTPVRLGWTHNQTFPAGQRLTANVDLQSSSARFVADDLADQVRQSSTSSVTYSQSWPGVGRSLNVQLRANQQFDVNSAQLTLPSVAFSQQRRFPFRRSTRDGRGERWYEKIGVSYSGNVTNAFSYTPKADSLIAGGSAPSWVDALFSQSAFNEGIATDINGEPTGERFAYGATHSVPVTASFNVPRYNLSITPSLTYAENWLNERTLRELDPASNEIVSSTDAGFTFDRRLRANLELGTELYGTTGLRIGAFDGFRHTLAPRVSLALEPDYARFGTVRTVTDSTGREIRYGTVPGVPTDPTASLRFSLNNAFLTRLARRDSTGDEQRETVQLLSLALSGGYNFAAEQRPLENLAFSANTRRGAFNATASGSFSFYALDEQGLLTEDTYLAASGRPARLTGLRFSSGYTLRSGSSRPIVGGGPTEPGLPAGPSTPIGGAPYDPSAPVYTASPLAVGPWDSRFAASLDLTAAYTPATATRDANWTATLGVNQFSMQLTPKWGLTGSTGFDFIQGKVSQVNLALRRDLHCWEMQIRWQPIGPVQAFGVSLYVKSGYLRDLLRLDLPNADFRSAFTNVGIPR